MLVTNKNIPNLWEYNPCDCVVTNRNQLPISPTPPAPAPNQDQYLEKYFNDSDLTVVGDLIIYGDIKDVEIYDNYGDLINPDNINFNNSEYVVINLSTYRPIVNFKYIAEV